MLTYPLPEYHALHGMHCITMKDIVLVERTCMHTLKVRGPTTSQLVPCFEEIGKLCCKSKAVEPLCVWHCSLMQHGWRPQPVSLWSLLPARPRMESFKSLQVRECPLLSLSPVCTAVHLCRSCSLALDHAPCSVSLTKG